MRIGRNTLKLGSSSSNKYLPTPGPRKRSHLQLPNSIRSIRKKRECRRMKSLKQLLLGRELGHAEQGGPKNSFLPRLPTSNSLIAKPKPANQHPMVASMVPPALSSDVVSLYYTKDVLLENLPVLIFYGPSTTGNSTQNSSLVQAHIYTLAGFQTFPRLTISPSSRFYAAVDHLPEDQRRDEVFRGLAVSMLSYFAGLSASLKSSLREVVARRRPNQIAPVMFDEMHAGELVSRMVKVDDAAETVNAINSALRTRSTPWLDIDIVLPPQTITRALSPDGSEHSTSFGEDGLPLYKYGDFDHLINSMGSPAFLPTSKMRRAPSKPMANSKSRSLLKDQKVSLRREMVEFFDTEERYLDKLDDLINSTAVEFRQQLENVGLDPSNVDTLFPSCLLTIFEMNKGFCDDIQEVLQQTENDAINDIEGTIHHGSDLSATTGRKRDATGIAAFAKVLLKWFPKFADPYQEFMRASSTFQVVVNEHLQDTSSPFSRTINEFGEQQLRSALIEPVQRLPRYSLFIDNMVNLLPSLHPGLASLLKARDMITDICALDSIGDNNRTISCLKNLTTDWPSSFSPGGRLITAVDVRQLSPPYNTPNEGRLCLLLLFSDALILLQKVEENALSARGIIAEVDRPIMPYPIGQSSNTSVEKGLKFQAAMSVASLQVTESEEDQLIWINCVRDLVSNTMQLQSSLDISQASTKVFSLLGAYEGKPRRLCEEVTKARLENRFPETLRESDKWTLRMISGASEDLSVLAAIWETDSVNDRIKIRDLSRVKVIFEKDLPSRLVLSENVGVDILAYVAPHEHDSCRLHIECIVGNDYTNETVKAQDLAAVLVQRLVLLTRSQGQRMSTSRVPYHRDVLQSLTLHKQFNESRIRGFRPISPVKLISNFLNAGMGIPSHSPQKLYGETPVLSGLAPKLRPLAMRFKSDESQSSRENLSNSKVTVIEAHGEKVKTTLTLLEDTFSTYISALRSRSGNVMGKVLRGRVGADELVVNELYNILVEDPSRINAAEDVSVDILFAAFEKFLKVAWSEHMGQFLPANVILGMQSRFDSGRHDEFTRHFKQCLEDMTPQNKRAFAATIKLLSELLDASGNDGDRGALIASFAEALVSDGNPHNYINLFDRIVDDYETFFDATPVFSVDEGKSAGSASNSLKRNGSFKTGSLSSNASSLGRRFGFGRGHDNRSDTDSKVASVWRTLSKTAKVVSDSQPQSNNLPKTSLVRSRSTDTDTRMLPPSRPVSRDLPPLPSPSASDEYRSRPGSSHLSFTTLSTIGEATPSKPAVLPKKKRRSSLSDLKPLNDPLSMSAWWSIQPRQTNVSLQKAEQVKTLPRTPSPSKSSFTGHENWNSSQTSPSLQRTALPQRFGSPQRLGSPERPGTSGRPGTSERPRISERPGTSERPERLSSPERLPPVERLERLASPEKLGKIALGKLPLSQRLDSPARSLPPERPERSTVPQRKENVPLNSRINQPKKIAPRMVSDEAVTITLTPKKRQSGIPAPKAGLSERAWPPNGSNSPKKLPLAPTQKLRVQSPQKLRERLGNEQKAIISTETGLKAEIARIGEEISTLKIQRPSGNPPTPATATPLSAIESLSTSLVDLATTLNKTIASLTASTSAIAKDLDTSLASADKKARKLDELCRETNAENEMLYERFNDELGKILAGVKGGNGTEEMKGRMLEAQAEVARLKGENSRLKREVAGLRSLIRDE